jgi:hypothetical protein
VRGTVNDPAVVNPLLLPPAPADILDRLNWDDAGAAMAALDQYFAQTANDAGTLAYSEVS